MKLWSLVLRKDVSNKITHPHLFLPLKLSCLLHPHTSLPTIGTKMSSQQIDQMGRPTSAFLSLPRELRDHIYEYLLTTTFLVKNPHTKEKSSSLQFNPNTRLAILNVSRSISEEATRVLYRNAHFRFNNLSVNGSYLHETIHRIPAITLLQDITLHVGICAFVPNELVCGERATRLIDFFADLDPGVPRKCCVVEIELYQTIIPSSFDTYITASDLTDALGRLMGFKTVTVTVDCLRLIWVESAEEIVEPLFDALSGRLTASLGEMDTDDVERWIYHPCRG